jgi:hypothetical protein
MTDAKFDFFGWFDKKEAAAKATPVGEAMIAAGYRLEHTGGGCLTWAKYFDDKSYIWICDEGNGPGDKLDEHYLLGLYISNGDDWIQDEIFGLKAALAWADAAHGALAICRKWTAWLGARFEPDTMGGGYWRVTDDGDVLLLDLDAITDYEADMAKLRLAPGNPDQYVTLAKQEAGHAR